MLLIEKQMLATVLYMTEMLLLIQLCESCMSLEAVCTVFGSALSYKLLKPPLSAFNPGNVPSLNSVPVPGTEAFLAGDTFPSYALCDIQDVLI